MSKVILFFSLLVFSIPSYSQSAKYPLLSAIKETDLKKDMYLMADGHFRGREAGTPDELKAAVWLATKAKEAGMLPAGDDGTFFQFFELYRHQVQPTSFVKIGEKNYALWTEVLVYETAPASINAPIVFLRNATAETVEKAEVKGKAVAIQASMDGISKNMSLFEKRYPGFVRNKYYKQLVAKGAAALILIADDMGEKSWAHILPALTRGVYGIEGLRDNIAPAMPVFWLHKSEAELVQNTGKNLITQINVQTYKYPSVNVVGKIEGTDPTLKKEYVLFSGHHDHEGIRAKYGNDSINYGADDNASTCVAMLAIARAFKKQPGKRSALFVFHGSEERGLLGSRWYAAHPTVPKENIIAVLNGDLIGRNDVNQAALLGTTPTHKTSDDLVNIALQANAEGPKFTLDKEWDKPEHSEYFFFRSDHAPYAKAGIPALFFTSMLHSEYHTPMDNAKNINYPKLYKMTEWIYLTGWKLANIKNCPKPIPDVKFER
jgi:hypothetical protein